MYEENVQCINNLDNLRMLVVESCRNLRDIFSLPSLKNLKCSETTIEYIAQCPKLFGYEFNRCINDTLPAIEKSYDLTLNGMTRLVSFNPIFNVQKVSVQDLLFNELDGSALYAVPVIQFHNSDLSLFNASFQSSVEMLEFHSCIYGDMLMNKIKDIRSISFHGGFISYFNLESTIKRMIFKNVSIQAKFPSTLTCLHIYNCDLINCYDEYDLHITLGNIPSLLYLVLVNHDVNKLINLPNLIELVYTSNLPEMININPHCNIVKKNLRSYS
jgi:hypothetical protein